MRWKVDLTTKSLKSATEAAPTVFTTVLNVKNWKLALEYDADNDKWIAQLVMTVKDVANEAVITGQSAALGSNLAAIGCMEPYKEFTSHLADHIIVANSGTTVATFLGTEGTSGGQQPALSLADSPFKHAV